ncbi:D-xylose-proton symporter-like 3 [Cardamine amara subsp. amara]|uniref:D-xylose-proton symporter-like 3 n=1 Tax=Cardamine amara subsp. amara TaxID=228776 RepID=A0ABD0ZR57_CARAN
MHVAPLYIAETCPPQIRGTLISLKELFIVLGILLGFSVGSFQIDVVGGWRYMYGFGTPVALLMGLGMWSLHASPAGCFLELFKVKALYKNTKRRPCKLRGRPPGDKLSEKLVDDALVSVKAAYEDEKSGGLI